MLLIFISSSTYSFLDLCRLIDFFIMYCHSIQFFGLVLHSCTGGLMCTRAVFVGMLALLGATCSALGISSCSKW